MAKRTYKGTVFNAGDRVMIHPCTDTWMQGDRYGTVEKITKGGATVHVRMDVSGKTITRHASLFSHVQA